MAVKHQLQSTLSFFFNAHQIGAVDLCLLNYKRSVPGSVPLTSTCYIRTHTIRHLQLIIGRSVRIDQGGFNYPAQLGPQTNSGMPERCSYNNKKVFQLVKQSRITRNNKPDNSEINSFWWPDLFERGSFRFVSLCQLVSQLYDKAIYTAITQVINQVI